MARNDGRRVRLPDGLIPAVCEIIGLALACVGVFLIVGLGWALIAAALSFLAVGFILGE